MSSAPKKLCIISSHADSEQVGELVKRLRPLEERNALELWYLAAVPPGVVVEKHLASFLPQADGVVIWIGPDLWNKDELYSLFQQNAALLQPHASIMPLLARHAVWESDGFLKSYESNLIPLDQQPMPTDSAERRDAWLKQTASSIAAGLGLTEPEQVQLEQNPSKIKSFWKNASPWEKFFAILGLVVAVSGLVFGILSYLNDRGIYPRRQEQPALAQRTNSIAADIVCDGFPAEFDSTHLYILITRFEDYANSNETECYGRGIEARIDEIKNRDNLPIKVCYVHSRSPNQSDAAARLRDSLNADIIVWGKLRDAAANCQAEGFCLKFQPSDTLVHYAGGQVSQKIDNDYQLNVSARDVEKGLINMGEERFDAWLISMCNLKIGKQKPDFYRIAPDWPVERQVKELYERSSLFLRLGNFNKTIDDCERILRLDSNYVDAYFNRGIAKSDLNLKEEAITDYNHAIQLKPDYTFAYNNRGIVKSDLGLKEEAISDYNHAIQLDPNYAHPYNNRGLAKSELGLKEEAISDYDRAIQLDPIYAYAYYNRGLAKSDLGLKEEAVADYDHVIQLDPNYAYAYSDRGIAKSDLGFKKEAIEDYDRAIQLDPNNAYAYYNRGIAKSDLGFKKEAIVDYDRAIQLYPDVAGGYYSRGIAKSDLGFKEEAIADYDRAIQLDSNHASAYNNRGLAKYELNRQEEAIADYGRAIQLYPDYADAYNNRGVAQSGLGLKEEAIADYDRAIQVDPNYALAYNNRGFAKAELGRKEEAIADYDRAIQLDPNFALAYNNRGLAKYNLGQYVGAYFDFWQTWRIRNLLGWRLYVAILTVVAFLTAFVFRKRILNSRWLKQVIDHIRR